MNYLIFDKEESSYKYGLLIKSSHFKLKELKDNYVTPLNSLGIPSNEIIAWDLKYTSNNKISVTDAKAYLDKLLKALDSLNITSILCCDATYFKVLTGVKRTLPYYGYTQPCQIKGYEYFKVVLCINYSVLFYDPTLHTKLDLSLKTLVNPYTERTSIIKQGIYPDTLGSIQKELHKLLKYEALTIDIETYSLKFNEAGLASISFAWDKHQGIAFLVENDSLIIKCLYDFFISYTGKCIYHNALFDVNVLTYVLYMSDLLDYKGMLFGIDTLTKNIEDTKLIAYLATNSCSGNNLGLKDLSHEYSGNYGLDVSDVTKINPKDLLEYNLKDTLSTWYVYDKYKPILIQDNQSKVYEEVLIPSLAIALQMQLSGMCIDIDQVILSEYKLTDIQCKYQNVLNTSDTIKKFTLVLTEQARQKDYLDRKTKAKNPDKIKIKNTYPLVKFNPNSSTHVRKLLFDYMGMESIENTDTGLPATGIRVLEQLPKSDIVEALIEISKTSKILTTFISTLKEKSILKDDGNYYIHGNYNISAVKSGRMSCSNPNLMQIPSGSTYAGLIKNCFIAPPNMVFVGADFNSLESVVNALITKDANKLRPLIEHIDSHSFNTKYYWTDVFSHIPDTAEGINTIKKDYKQYRQDSKAITFALSYQGTYRTLQKNSGLSYDDAFRIETNYHKLYKESDEWTQVRLDNATSCGYVEGAFGLRLRTPILKQTLLNTKVTPQEAEQESRTAGNMLSGQSYSLLNNRAAIEFTQRVKESKYKYDIRVIAVIHDAIYIYCKNTLGCVHWVNTNLIECMEWDELPELKHDIVKLGAELDVFKVNWSNPITLKNKWSIKDIWNKLNN